jgi:hypothetical protein
MKDFSKVFDIIENFRNILEVKSETTMASSKKNSKAPAVRIQEFDIQSMPLSCTWVVIGPPATGKCFARDTEILMYDMSVKKVQDVSEGDVVMGDDSTPRLVSGVTSGREKMYRITNTIDGTSYTVNESHVLCLCNGEDGEVYEFSVKDYIFGKCWEKNDLKGYRVPVDINPRIPYGGGMTDQSGITHAEECARLHSNLLLKGYEVKIPNTLLFSRRSEREAYVKTLADETGGYNLYEFTSLVSIPLPSEGPIDTFIRLVRSLGLTITGINTHKGQRRLVFDGRGLVDPQAKILNDIEIEELQEDTYYGFCVDKNGRFLLGDFTVTHNTTLMENFAYYLKHKYPVGRVFIGTEDGYKRFCEIFHPLYVNLGWSEEEEKRHCTRQKLCISENGSGYMGNLALNIIDDCSDDPRIYKSQLMRAIFKLGSQHWNQICLIGSQYAIDMPPDVRKSISYVAIGREPEPIERKKLYENFGGLAGSYERFSALLDQITGDHTFLIIKKRSESNELEDCFFWYKTKVLPSWRFGCREAWKHAEERYDPNYVDKIGF